MPLPAGHAIGTVPDYAVTGTSLDAGKNHATDSDTIPGDLANQLKADVITLYDRAGKTPASDAAVAATKGNLIAGDGSVFKALSVGTNGQVLQADSTAANGVKWGAVEKVKGSDGTTNAAAGDVGEYPTPGSAAAITIPGASGEYGDICSLALSAGDWDISAVAVMGGNGATVTGSSFGVGTASGNNGTGLVNGDTFMSFPPPSSSSQSGSALAGIRVKPTTTPTTYYLKVIGYYSGGSPNVWGRLSARRIR